MLGCCLQVAKGGSEEARTSTSGMKPSGLLASMLSSCVCVCVCVRVCVCVCFVIVVVSDQCGCLSMSGVTLR